MIDLSFSGDIQKRMQLERPLSPATPDFWNCLADHGNAVALLQPHIGRSLTYRELASAVDLAADRLMKSKGRLAILRSDNSVDSIIVFLAALRAHLPLFLIDHLAPAAAFGRLMQAYQPDMVISRSGSHELGGFAGRRFAVHDTYICVQGSEPGPDSHADLALILSTSGSVGNPKAVRLSRINLSINAWQIAQALAISAGARTALALPLAYTYGLSVLTSNLLVGGVLVVQDKPVIDPQFWVGCALGRVQTLPSVTFTLDFLSASRWTDIRPPSLKNVIHSGGRLSIKAQAWLLERVAVNDFAVTRMYGMTEATARLSVLPPEEFAIHPTSVGRAVQGGSFQIDVGGQIVYCGPNVMMGYAESRTDLARGDVMGAQLTTGDVGWLDDEQRLTITGRLHRFAKIFGLRINLAEMEDYLAPKMEAAVVSDDQRIVVYHTLCTGASLSELQDAFCTEFRLPPQMVAWRPLKRLPRANSGKVLYGELIC